MSRRPIHIYADESCLGNQFQARANPGAAAGMIERFDARKGWHRRDYFRHDPDTTNNRMAILSAILGLRALRRPSDVVFVSDSQYLIKGMREWIHGWAARGWRRKGGEIENLELWRELAGVVREHRVQWRWVRGHDQDVKNEYANHLAVTCAQSGEDSNAVVASGFDTWLEAQMDRGRFTDFLDVPDESAFRPDRAPPSA